MHIARTALVTLGTSLLLWTGVAHFQPAGAVEPATASLRLPTDESPVLLELTSDEVNLVGWARDRFALVGLDFPAVEISFHAEREPCNGNQGIYQDDGRARVLVCIPDYGTSASNLQRERTLVHELAHAWEQANLDDAERQALLEILDADDWYGPETAWEERGAERFAETIVWGLYDQLRRPTLIDTDCAEVHADFREITGHLASGPTAEACNIDAE